MVVVKTGVEVQAVYVLLDYSIYVVDADAHVLHFYFAEEYWEESPYKQ
jgi:hypothetical protein